MKKFLIILPITLLLLSCGKSGLEPSEEHPVLFSLDTKSLGEGERTFRVALFRPNNELAAEGTYCSETLIRSTGNWLSPCWVDNNGFPLKSDGTEAIGLAQADKNSKYGLRAGSNINYYLVVSSPAIAFEQDEITSSLRYYLWTPTTATDIYVSDPVLTTLAGSWLDGEYVYASSTREALKLKNRSARIRVHIECGKLGRAEIQSVTLLNYTTSARWYMTTGFSSDDGHYTMGSETLFHYSTDGGIMTLKKEDSEGPEVTWTSDYMFIPSINYRGNVYSAMQPVIEVRMGSNTAQPAIARVRITENVEPMKNYTYNLKVSQSQVIISLSVDDWDELADDIDSVDEAPEVIETVTVGGWTDGGTNNASEWNTSF